MTNDQFRLLLEDIRDALHDAMKRMDPDHLDPRLVYTHGFVFGALTEGLDAEREKRSLRMDERGLDLLREIVRIAEKARETFGASL